jgi:hypothetical protein
MPNHVIKSLSYHSWCIGNELHIGFLEQFKIEAVARHREAHGLPGFLQHDDDPHITAQSYDLHVGMVATLPVNMLPDMFHEACNYYTGNAYGMGEMNIYEYSHIVLQMVKAKRAGRDCIDLSSVPSGGGARQQGPDQGTADSGNVQTAASDAHKGRRSLSGGSGSSSASKAGGTGGGGGSRTGFEVGTSLTTVLDIFITLMQKLGVWMYNLVPNLDVTLPAFNVSMSWLQFPAIGWELTLTLPELEKRGWLYWTVLIAGISLPFYLGYVIRTDDGNLRTAMKSKSGDAEEGRNNAEEFMTYEDYQAAVARSKGIFCGVFAVLFIVCIAAGAAVSDGQLIGLGVLSLLLVVARLMWDYAKNYVLVTELAAHDRKLEPSYRSMRVFVNSTVFLLILRSIYIMTISALCQVIMDPQDSDGNVSLEAIFSYIMIAPTMICFPHIVYKEGKKFQTKYVDLVSKDMGQQEFRGWLSRFAVRETTATMLECTIASMFMPFERDMWHFSVMQLVERALATVFATVLVSNSLAQVTAAIVIEFSLGLSEAWFAPFTNNAEDLYNVIWRVLAGLILVVMLLLDILGENFATAGDVSLVILTWAATCFFLYAIDVPRLYRGYQLAKAVSAFRKYELTEKATLGSIGLDISIDDETVLEGDKTLSKAIKEVYVAGVFPDEVVRDSFSYAQLYKLAIAAKDNEQLHRVLITHSLMWKVAPLLSLDGCQLGGPIPPTIGMFSNVMILSMANMALDDKWTNSLEPLGALHKLQSLSLDGNLFQKRIPGLHYMTGLEKLSIRNLKMWEGDNEGTVELTEAIMKMPNLCYLDMKGTDMLSEKGAISFEFIQFLNIKMCPPDATGLGLGPPGLFTKPDGGKYSPAWSKVYQIQRTNDSDAFDVMNDMPFSVHQYNAGGVTGKQCKSHIYEELWYAVEAKNVATVKAIVDMEGRVDTGYGLELLYCQTREKELAGYPDLLFHAVDQLLNKVPHPQPDMDVIIDIIEALVDAGADPTVNAKQVTKPGYHKALHNVIRTFNFPSTIQHTDKKNSDIGMHSSCLERYYPRAMALFSVGPSPTLVRKTRAKKMTHACWDCFEALKNDGEQLENLVQSQKAGEATYLWHACNLGKTACVTDLLAAGANYHTRGKGGGTCMAAAQNGNHLEVMALLTVAEAGPKRIRTGK